MKRLIIVCVSGVALALVLGFQQHKVLSEEEIIARGVEIKIEEFRKKQHKICREKVIKAAVVQVDSIIRTRARQEAIEPVVKPPKPTKPEMPLLKQLPDSLDQDSLKMKY